MRESKLKSQLRCDSGARTLSFFFTEDISAIDAEMIEDLKKISKESGNQNARICLHPSPKSNHHDMIILEYPGSCYPHKHLGKGETLHIIEGRVAAFAFDSDGNIVDSRLLGSRGNLIFRVGPERWHAVVTLPPFAVYHESKSGPFVAGSDSIYPDWAPDPADSHSMSCFTKDLLEPLIRQQ